MSNTIFNLRFVAGDECYAVLTGLDSSVSAAQFGMDQMAAFGSRFDQAGALWLGVVYKTVLYTAVAFLVVVAEKAFHAYRESRNLGESLKLVWEHRDRNVMLATSVCIGLAFAGYNLYLAIDRRVGEGTLRRLIWGR